MSRIAIVGSGIAGLTCAHYLAPKHRVTLFEANDYVGGHTATVDVEVNGKSYAIDTGFIVFNDRTYPRFQSLLKSLDVPVQKTQMSFSVYHPAANLIYNGHTLNSLFCQRSNLISPRFWRFILEILRFNKFCKSLYHRETHAMEGTLGEFLYRKGFSRFFSENYILPMGAAIWSASLRDIEKFPLRFFVQFFFNHGLLDIVNRPQWYTVIGGSREYVKALLAACPANVRLQTPVSSVSRAEVGVNVRLENGDLENYDRVIFACHSDQALALLSDPNVLEREILGAIPYQRNDVVLHQDKQLLPPLEGAKASWNYHFDGCSDRPATVTYSMNILQCLGKDAPMFNVTLNSTTAIEPSKILRRFRYSHPVFSETMVAAQGQRHKISGVDRLHYCGAYWYNGFHEDGVRSAEDVCREVFNDE